MVKKKRNCGKTVCLVNLGCHKNQVDAETILGQLDDAGFVLTSNPEDAEIIIINSCGFLKAARDETIEMLHQMRAYRKTGRLEQLVVSGCMADGDRDHLLREVDDIDQFVSPFRLDAVSGLLQPGAPLQKPRHAGMYRQPVSLRWVSTPRSYGFVKIADGCDNSCAYCRIPFLRGSFRSKPPVDILMEAAELVESGRREIVLISQDSTAYGKDHAEWGDLPSLLKRMAGLPGLRWIRLMYLHPSRVDETLLQVMTEHPVICRYLDIPLQHVDPNVLRRMNRSIPGPPGRSPGNIYRYICDIRRRVPGIAIRTTLMTGYPGETEEAYRNMLELVDSGAFDHLGVFAWSPEPDTEAFSYRFDAVDSHLAEERAARLLAAQAEVVESRSQERLNRVYEVVVDGPDDALPGWVTGRTEFQAPDVDGWVRIQGDYPPGSWLRVLLTGVEWYDYEGVVIEKLQ